MNSSHQNYISKKHIESYLAACHECVTMCEISLKYCLTLGGHFSTSQHIKALLDCSDFCTLSAKWTVRESNLHNKSCELCRLVCNACAESCHQFGSDEVLQKCAESCIHCAKSCLDFFNEDSE